MDKKERMLRFINSLYIPVNKREDCARLIEFIANNPLRDIEADDAHDVGVKLLMIETRGKGQYETFDEWTIMRADFDAIGIKYASAYVYVPCGRGRPQRLYRNSNKIAVII